MSEIIDKWGARCVDAGGIEERYVTDDELGDDLDEIVARGAFVHLERMDNGWFYLGIDLPDGSTKQFGIGSKSGRATVKAWRYS